MELENFRFKIEPIGGKMAKEDRIRRLVPTFENSRFWLPYRLMYVDKEKKAHDLISEFITDEFGAFPVAVHDDMLDNLARILDPKANVVFPDLVPLRYQSITQGPSETATANTEYDPLG